MEGHDHGSVKPRGGGGLQYQYVNMGGLKIRAEGQDQAAVYLQRVGGVGMKQSWNTELDTLSVKYFVFGLLFYIAGFLMVVR